MGMRTEDKTGLGLAFGSEQEGMSWIGKRLERRAEVPVNDAMIRNYCSLVEDANPDYWEGGISPPGLLMSWMMPLPWRPGPNHRRSGLLALDVPLPGHHIINVSTDTEFSTHLRVGDLAGCVEEVTDVSPLKKTRLGEGHFVTTVSTFDVGGRAVARNTNLLYRYDTPSTVGVSAPDASLEERLADSGSNSGQAYTDGGSDPSRPPARGLTPAVGDDLPEVRLDISYQRVVLNAAATWDWFPGHHNPFYARSQGQRTIYLSTIFFHGFVDRLVTDWAGPGAFVTRRKITMRSSIFAGETAIARGRVVALHEETDGLLVDIEASVDGPDGPCVPAEVTVRLPR